MTSPGTALAFSGAIGSGKSKVSAEVKKLLGWPLVSFGDYVRAQAKAAGLDDTDRAVLQKVGQALVLRDLEGFVRGVLAQDPSWEDADGVLIDGLRHAEVRVELKRQVAPKILKHVLVKVDEDTRVARAQKDKEIESHILSHYDQDITEAQIARILPAYADLEIDNSLTSTMTAQEIIRRLDLHSAAQAAE